MYGYVSGLPDFLAYFVTGMVLLVVFATIYTLVTPQKELTLVRAGNAAATTAYLGALVGFSLPLASAAANSVSLVDFAIWAAGAVPIPLYETSSAEQVHWILTDSGVSLLFVETAEHAGVVARVRAEAPALRDVLVIDDEAPIRLLCRVNLEAEGMTVSEAADGPSGLEKARADRPDVILLDVMMPVMDGPTTFHRLQEDPLTASIPVILLTAKVQVGLHQVWHDLDVAGGRSPGADVHACHFELAVGDLDQCRACARLRARHGRPRGEHADQSAGEQQSESLVHPPSFVVVVDSPFGPGSSSQNVDPSPGSLSKPMLPPCASTICR